MIKWLLYLIPYNFICILCYFLNPIIVLFCDDEGELKGWLHYFQTYDDSCDSSYYMRGKVPSFLNYDFDKHYYTVEGVDYFRHDCVRTYTRLKEGCTWTKKEKVQRYFCRVLWLMRNCAYGFRHYVFSEDMTGINLTVKNRDNFWGFMGSKFFKPFVYKNENIISKHLAWKIYIGWKTYPNNENAKNCMMTSRVLLKWVN